MKCKFLIFISLLASLSGCAGLVGGINLPETARSIAPDDYLSYSFALSNPVLPSDQVNYYTSTDGVIEQVYAILSYGNDTLVSQVSDEKMKQQVDGLIPTEKYSGGLTIMPIGKGSSKIMNEVNKSAKINKMDFKYDVSKSDAVKVFGKILG